MPLSITELEAIVGELAIRPRHEKVRSLGYKLLTDGLGAASHDVVFEQQTDRLDRRRARRYPSPRPTRKRSR